MRARLCILVAACLGAIIAAPAFGQRVIDPSHKFSWSENAGWMNWADGAFGGGVRVSRTYLSGVIWGENTGWVLVGSVPANHHDYANTESTNYGVNIDQATGAMSGYAWGENIGWINFAGGALASPANPARYDAAAKRFRGYAWGENIGWINLDDIEAYIATLCAADFNHSGQVTVQDIFDFLAAWFANQASADFNHNGMVSVQDVFDFLTAWFSMCA